jgi:siderophore synthetase component
MRAFDLRALVALIRSRSDLDEDAAMALAREELEAARAEARNRPA